MFELLCVCSVQYIITQTLDLQIFNDHQIFNDQEHDIDYTIQHSPKLSDNSLGVV